MLLISELSFVSDVRCVKQFILDEADEMLSRGFKEQIYDVFRTLPDNVQVIAISTLMKEEVILNPLFSTVTSHSGSVTMATS